MTHVAGHVRLTLLDLGLARAVACEATDGMVLTKGRDLLGMVRG